MKCNVIFEMLRTDSLKATETTAERSQRMSNLALICALLVVWIHLWGPTEMHSWAGRLYACTTVRFAAVPTFFLFSGYFLVGHIESPSWWKDAVRKRISSLLVPYALWCLLSAAVCLMGRPFSWSDVPALLGLDLCRPPLAMHLWYLRGLMVYVLLSPILLAVLRRVPRTVLLLCYALSGICFGWHQQGTGRYCLAYVVGFSHLFFFLLGMALRLGLVALPRNRLLLALSVLSLPLTRDLRLLPFSIVPMMYVLWRMTPAWHLPRDLTGLAFPIYLLHWIVLQGVGRVTGSSVDTVPRLLGHFALVVGVSAALAVLLRRMMPRVASVLFGGRV